VLAYAFAGLVGLPWASCRAWADAWDALFLPRVRPLASFPSCGARFSARASHAARLFVAVRGCDAPSLPAPSISVRCTWHRAVRWGASHEVARRVPFSVRRSRRAVRGYRPSGLSRSDVRLAGTAPTPSADSSLRFSAPRVFDDFNFAFVKTPPQRVIRDRFLSVHVPGPRGTVLATWPGPLARSRRRSWDLLTPFAVLLRFAGGRAPFPARPEPTCRFASDPPRDIGVARDPTVLCGRTTGFGRGSWVFAPQTSRTVPLADPAIAFARRVARIHRPRLPWAWSPLSGVRHRSAASTSEGASAPELPAPSSLRGCMPRRDDHACSSTLDGTDD
jgi:hypothetical protein